MRALAQDILDNARVVIVDVENPRDVLDLIVQAITQASNNIRSVAAEFEAVDQQIAQKQYKQMLPYRNGVWISKQT